MSKQSHTPGPWTYKPHGRAEKIAPSVVVLEDDGGCGDPECCGAPSYWIEIKPEDAYLIAAAPELLKELTHLASLLHPWIEAGNSVPGIATLNGAWAAIKKARGEQ